MLRDKNNKIKGLVLVEVDDLLMAGDNDHQVYMEKLKKRFKFGKWKQLS